MAAKVVNMNGKHKQPKTLQAAIIFYANPDNCLDYMVNIRWPEGVACPTCSRTDVVFLANQRKWQCKSVHAKRQFSAKVGTIFEDSPIPLEKWLVAVWMLSNCRNGVSSYEIGRTIGVTQKSAWFMMHRIRLAMQRGSFIKMGGGGGEIEVDETFIGGKARNMHKAVHARRIPFPGKKDDKTIAFGILERGKEIRTMVIKDRTKDTVLPLIREHVQTGTSVYTDDMGGYRGLAMNEEFIHGVVDHANKYVDGRIHTNGLENFWSLLKRGISGTYVAVEPFHLFRYLDEQSFRYNNRGTKKNPTSDAKRFHAAMSGIVGKRLTYAGLTGKVGETTAF
jgi:transposase-like protein